MMSPELFRRVRAALGFSVEGMAQALRLDPASGARTLRRWEAGTARITGPVQIACVALLREHAAWIEGRFKAGIPAAEHAIECRRVAEEVEEL